MIIPPVTVPPGQKGPWTIKRFSVEAMSLENLRYMRDGRGCLPGEYTQLRHAQRGVVMSDTTAERRDHYEFVVKAKGVCLINGLGLGMCLQAALAKQTVEFVIVVELEQDVIDLVWPHYAGQRCKIIHASAFDHKPPRGVRYGAVWHDIWDEISEDNLSEMARLHRKYGRVADWQGSWGKPAILRARRQDKRSSYWR